MEKKTKHNIFIYLFIVIIVIIVNIKSALDLKKNFVCLF